MSLKMDIIFWVQGSRVLASRVELSRVQASRFQASSLLESKRPYIQSPRVQLSRVQASRSKHKASKRPVAQSPSVQTSRVRASNRSTVKFFNYEVPNNHCNTTTLFIAFLLFVCFFFCLLIFSYVITSEIYLR